MFREIITKYANVTKLTPELLADTIDKIIVGERERVNGKWQQSIEIYYRFVGLI